MRGQSNKRTTDRHSTITLMMNRDTHLSVLDLMGDLVGTDAEAKDRGDAKLTGSKRLDEVRNEASEHHHGAPDGEANTHSAVARSGADAGERLVLALGVKAHEAACAAVPVTVE